ncbi:MAG: putative septation protein SpoVG [Phycisphaerae bacterium]|nr:putative septation protein SpoVG [Phycisphaerae bacterium]
MEISEVRVKLLSNSKERLRAFCSITFDNEFVIRDLKIIDGVNGIFVAMPSRKLADRCDKCGTKNHLRSRFCNECGRKLDGDRVRKMKRRKLHADIAHPINTTCRERIQQAVVKAFEEELEKSKLPGYQPVSLGDEDDFDVFEEQEMVEVSEGATEDATVGHGDAVEPLVPAENRTERPAREQRRTARPQPREEAPARTPRTERVPVTNERSGDRRRERGRSENYDNAGGYDELIAELKRDAAKRRGGPVEEDTIDEPLDTVEEEVLVPAAVEVEKPASPPVRTQKNEERPGNRSTESTPTDDFGAGLV